jgi:hypothetical protein
MKGAGERDQSGRFVRGLTLGALIGAIVAGSSIWTRVRSRRRAIASEDGGPETDAHTEWRDIEPPPGKR